MVAFGTCRKCQKCTDFTQIHPFLAKSCVRKIFVWSLSRYHGFIVSRKHSLRHLPLSQSLIEIQPYKVVLYYANCLAWLSLVINFAFASKFFMPVWLSPRLQLLSSIDHNRSVIFVLLAPLGINSGKINGLEYGVIRMFNLRLECFYLRL